MTVAASVLPASDFSFQGTFSTDDQVQLFDFTLASAATVTFRSFGYAGGTNAMNAVIQPGGFDSYFTWFAAGGAQIGFNDDGGCGNVGEYNGACADAFFQPFLMAGTYTLALTESGNDPNGDLSDGFSAQGNGDFTANGPCTAFCDSFGNTDSGNWAVDISSVDSAVIPGSTPEPITMLLTGCGLVLIGLAKRRRVG